LPDLYIPRGYLSTRHAVDRLFEARHADLVSGATEREEEEGHLYAIQSADRYSGGHPRDLRDVKRDESMTPQVAEHARRRRTGRLLARDGRVEGGHAHVLAGMLGGSADRWLDL
jgi:hypothetical protein